MAKPHVAPLTRGPVRLRLLEERDLPMTLAWRNQDHIRPWFLTSQVITPEQHRGWFENYRQRHDDFVFVIEEIDTLKRPVGQASIYRIDRDHCTAEFGRMIIGDDDARGQGLAKLATQALVQWAFEGLGLREVHLEVRTTNATAIHVYQACGFEIISTRDGVAAMRRTAPASGRNDSVSA